MNDSDWVAVAVLRKPRGNRGELTAYPLTSRPGRFGQLKKVWLSAGSLDSRAYEIERVWEHDGTPIFKFRGVDSISQAEALRGAEVRIPKAERVLLDADEYFQSDLIGFTVVDAAGRPIGRVTAWEEYGGPALLEIDNGRLLIPFVKTICTEIRPADRVIRVEMPEGLESLGEE